MGGGVRSGGSRGARGGCERGIEVFVKIQKKIGGGWVGGSGWRGQGVGGWVWGGRVGVRVDVNEELKFLGKFTKKIGGGGGGREEWSGGGRVGGGVRVDVNAMLGVGGDVGYGNQE